MITLQEMAVFNSKNKIYIQNFKLFKMVVLEIIMYFSNYTTPQRMIKKLLLFQYERQKHPNLCRLSIVQTISFGRRPKISR